MCIHLVLCFRVIFASASELFWRFEIVPTWSSRIYATKVCELFYYLRKNCFLSV